MSALHRYTARVKVPAIRKYDPAIHDYREIAPETTVLAFLEIELEEVARRLGQRAWRSKGKKAHQFNGLVRCTEVREIKS